MDVSGGTPAHEASGNFGTVTLRVLHELGVDLNANSNFDLVFFATLRGDIRTVRMLHGLGGDVNASFGGKTPAKLLTNTSSSSKMTK